MRFNKGHDDDDVAAAILSDQSVVWNGLRLLFGIATAHGSSTQVVRTIIDTRYQIFPLENQKGREESKHADQESCSGKE